MNDINHRELILRTYERKKHDKICWQPRIMLYYNSNGIVHKKLPKHRGGTFQIEKEERSKFVPNEWLGKNIIDIHKDIDS